MLFSFWITGDPSCSVSRLNGEGLLPGIDKSGHQTSMDTRMVRTAGTKRHNLSYTLLVNVIKTWQSLPPKRERSLPLFGDVLLSFVSSRCCRIPRRQDRRHIIGEGLEYSCFLIVQGMALEVVIHYHDGCFLH